jgi:hypothetical protein
MNDIELGQHKGHNDIAISDSQPSKSMSKSLSMAFLSAGMTVVVKVRRHAAISNCFVAAAEWRQERDGTGRMAAGGADAARLPASFLCRRT